MRLTDTSDLWWKTAVFYNLDVETYLDADDDGVGDLHGLAQRLDHLAELGVTCLWLAPSYPSMGGSSASWISPTRACWSTR